MRFFSSPDQIKALEQNIKKWSGIILPEDQKTKMKHQIIKTIERKVFVNKIKQIAAEIVPTVSFRTLLREKLIMIVEFNSNMLFFKFERWFLCRRKILASVLISILLLTVVFNFTLSPQRAEASFITVLEEVNGEVNIVRDMRTFKAESGFILRANDVISTGQNSKAVIRFLDQSLSRLDEDTEVRISRLFINPFNTTETFVELVLQRGRLWSRVINLVDNLSRFQVKTTHTLAVAKKKAAFNVAISDEGKAKVSAVQNKVDIVMEIDQKTVETTLVKGFSAEVKTDESIPSQLVLEKKTATQQDQKWIDENLEKDQAYIEEIKQEVSQNVSELSLTPFAKFDINQKKLADAVFLIERGYTDKAKVLIDEAIVQFKIIIEWLKDYEIEHPVEALALKTQITEFLNGYKKNFALFLPRDPLYIMKATVDELHILLATDSSQVTREKLSQAEDKLLEAHDLVTQGDVTTAKEQVEGYTKTMSEVISDINQLPADKKEEAVTAVLDNRLEGLKTLEAFPAGEINLVGSDTLEESVTAAKEEALTTLGEAVVTASKIATESSMVKQLKDINDIDVNGKKFLDVKITQDQVVVTTTDVQVSVDKMKPAAEEEDDEEGNEVSAPVISIPVTGSSTTTINLKSSKLLPVQP